MRPVEVLLTIYVSVTTSLPQNHVPIDSRCTRLNRTATRMWWVAVRPGATRWLQSGDECGFALDHAFVDAAGQFSRGFSGDR
jgi:hypothetical protein